MLGSGCDIHHKSGAEHEENVIILDCYKLPKERSKKKRKCSSLMRIRNSQGFKESQGKRCDDSEEIAANKNRT